MFAYLYRSTSSNALIKPKFLLALASSCPNPLAMNSFLPPAATASSYVAYCNTLHTADSKALALASIKLQRLFPGIVSIPL